MKKRNIISIILWILLVIILGVAWLFAPSSIINKISYETISLNKFYTILQQESSNIHDIHINNNTTCFIRLKQQETVFTAVLPKNQSQIIQQIIDNNITLYLQSNLRLTTWQIIIIQSVAAIVQFVLQILFIQYLFRIRLFDDEQTNKQKIKKIKFDDIIGMEKEKKELKYAYEYMTQIKKYKKLGFQLQNGIIMSGPPGNGKTYLAKALAGEFDCHFIGTTAAEFVALYVGSGPLKIREIYEEARENSPCIVFIDEVDAIGSRGENRGGGDREYHATINQLLVELDGINDNSQVLTILATNLIDNIDPAILRSGRIGKHIVINKPTETERHFLITKLLEKSPLSHRLSIDHVAKLTSGESRADIVNLIEGSFQYSMRKAVEQKANIYDIVVSPADLDEMSVQSWCGEKTELHYTEKEIINTTYHEIGHAFLYYCFKDILTKMIMITIEPRDRVMGFVAYYEDEHEAIDLEKLRARICVCLAGSLAEKIFQNRRTPGCSSDIQESRRLAELYVLGGMNDQYGLHSISIKRAAGGYDSLVSEKEKANLYDEVTKLINELTEVTLKILNENQAIIHKFYHVLRKEMTIRGDDIYRLFDDKQLSTDLIHIQYTPMYQR